MLVGMPLSANGWRLGTAILFNAQRYDLHIAFCNRQHHSAALIGPRYWENRQDSSNDSNGSFEADQAAIPPTTLEMCSNPMFSRMLLAIADRNPPAQMTAMRA